MLKRNNNPYVISHKRNNNPYVISHKRNNNPYVSYKKSKSGFTLVELIIVIVVLGILAAIGIPRYNKYVNESRLAHIKADMKAISSLVEVTAIKDDGIYKGDPMDDLSDLEEAISEGRVYKEGNLLTETGVGGVFYVLEDAFIENTRSKLKGTFLVDESDEVYYIHNKKLKGENKESIVLSREDFEWISHWDGYIIEGEEGIGYYRYSGNDKSVTIPHKINGHAMTSYFGMFFGTSVEKVISTNKNIVRIAYMFDSSQAQTLDISDMNTDSVTDTSGLFAGVGVGEKSNVTKIIGLDKLNTSNVTNMAEMFQNCQVKNLDLRNFNTSNVTDMSRMFEGYETDILDLSNFDTSKVTKTKGMFQYSNIGEINFQGWTTSKITNMDRMFEGSFTEVLDLRSFNLSNTTSMDYMFSDAKATTGYAGTEADVDKFNDSFQKPFSLTFRLK